MINWLKTKNFYLIFGLILVAYMFYIRVILVRLPKDLFLWDDNKFYFNMCLMAFIWVTLSIYFIFNSIFSLLKKEIKLNKIKIILVKLQELIERSLYEVYRLPDKFLDNGYDTLANLANKFYEFWGKRDERIFVFIPYIIRIIILFAFLFDVFVNFKLDYFYRCLILLCFPISITLLFFMLKDFCSNLEDAENMLIIEYEGIDIEINLPITNYSPAPGYEDIDIEYHVLQYILLNKLNGYLELYLAIQKYYSPSVNLIIYSLYLVGWLFVIIKNIYWIL